MGCGNGRLSVEKRREKRVAGSEVVDAFLLARIELNEFRGSGVGLGGGDRTSSSGVVTIIVTGARGECLKIVEDVSFRRFKERGSGKYPSDPYWTTAGLYSEAIEDSSVGSFVLKELMGRPGACLLFRVTSGFATDRTVALVFSPPLLTILGIGGGSRDGAESFHEASTVDSILSEFWVPKTGPRRAR